MKLFDFMRRFGWLNVNNVKLLFNEYSYQLDMQISRSEADLELLKEVLKAAPNIQYLNLSASAITSNISSFLSKYAPNLKSLNLSECEEIDWGFVKKMYQFGSIDNSFRMCLTRYTSNHC